MRQTRCVVIGALLALGAFVGSAAAECAWVLWVKEPYSQRVPSFVKEWLAREWSPVRTSRSEEECFSQRVDDVLKLPEGSTHDG